MKTITRYPTRPLECWGKMVEMLHQHFRHSSQVRERGGVAIVHIGDFMPSLFSGIGEFATRNNGPYFAPAMKDQSLLAGFHESAEIAGYPSGEMCSVMHHYIGQLLSATAATPGNGVAGPVDLAFQVNFCSSPVKMGQLTSETLGVPYFVIDIPQEATPGAAVNYVAGQMEDLIEWLTRVTGREYDDEKLIAGVRTEWEVASLWARLCELNKAIPAPLDFYLLRRLCAPSQHMRSEPETAAFNRMLLDEIKQRVEEGVSVTGYETCRLLFEGTDVLFAQERFFSHPHPYGASLFMGRAPLVRGAWEALEDGSYVPAPTPAQRGMRINDRASALRALAELYAEKAAPLCRMLRLSAKAEEIVKRAQDWRADAVVLHLDIGCRSIALGFMEAKHALQQAGIPALTFEGSSSDPRYLNEPQVVEQLNAFMEGLGLRRLPETPHPSWLGAARR